MAELVCPTHGPYDASYGACPYCSGKAKRPPAPTPLDDDDLPTDFGDINQPPGGRFDDDVDPTELGFDHFLDDATELDYEDMSTQAILWVKDGDRRGRIYHIKDGSVVGRKEGDVLIDDPKVSSPHAKFTREDDTYILWDFGSKNGTRVNGERIRAATELKENDVIKFGDTYLVLKILD